MNKYRDFRRQRDRSPNLASTAQQQNGSIKIRLEQAAAINIPIKVDRASSGRLENVSSLSLYSMLAEVLPSYIARNAIKLFQDIFFRYPLVPSCPTRLVLAFRNSLLDDRVSIDMFLSLPNRLRSSACNFTVS